MTNSSSPWSAPKRPSFLARILSRVATEESAFDDREGRALALASTEPAETRLGTFTLAQAKRHGWSVRFVCERCGTVKDVKAADLIKRDASKKNVQCSDIAARATCWQCGSARVQSGFARL